VKPGAEMCALREDRSWLTGSESSLSRAERHLVEVYREEVAYALRAAAWRVIATSSEGVVRVVRRYGASITIPIPTGAEVRVQAAKALRGDRGSPEVRGVIGALELLSGTSDSVTVDPVALCSVAHAIVPSSRGRILAACAHQLAGKEAQSKELLVRAINAAPTSDLVAAAWHGLSESAINEGRWTRARLAQGHAHAANPELVSPLIGQLWCSIRMENMEAALDAARTVDELASAEPSSLDEHTARYRVLGKAMRRDWSPRLESVLCSVRDRSPESVRRLLSALG